MRKLTIMGATITAIVALSALASTMASAAKPEFSATGIKFTSFSGKGTLAVKGGNTIECESDTNSGEITGAKTTTLVVTFRTCKIFGIVGAHSLGDAENTILVAATGALCYLNEAKKEVGLILTPTGEVHIEAPGAKALALIKNALIGQMTPVNTKTLRFELILKQSGGEQALLTCGGTTTHSETSENGGAFKASGEQTTDAIGLLIKEAEILA